MTRTERQPRWTRSRARRLLILAGADDGAGHLDTTEVAARVDRSRRTVQRWFHGHPNALLPPSARQRVAAALAPDDFTRRREQDRTRYAADAVERRRLPKGRLVPDSWRKQGWLDDHVVAVLHHTHLRVRQVAAVKFTSRSIAELRRRGDVDDVATVPGRFEADLVVAAVLEQVDAWRIAVDPLLLQQGHTMVWTDDAPEVTLTRLAVTTGAQIAPVNR